MRQNTISGMPFNYKKLLKQSEPTWPHILEWATKTELDLNWKKSGLTKSDMETISYMLGENPYGACKIRNLSLSLCQEIRKEGAKILAPALALNKSIQYLNLSSCRFGVSGVKQVAEALKQNSSIQTLNLFHNICDVDGARAIGDALKVNSTLSFLDIGHNRIRITGLKALTEGILANPNSKLNKLGLRSNFINDEGLSYLFEALVLPKAGRKQQLTSLFLR